MPAKCVIVEVIVGGVSEGVDPQKVAQQVKWAIEGATVFPWRVQKVQGDESAEVSQYERIGIYLERVRLPGQTVKWLPPRPSSETS